MDQLIFNTTFGKAVQKPGEMRNNSGKKNITPPLPFSF